MSRLSLTLALASSFAVFALHCGRAAAQIHRLVPGADIARGAALIRQLGCGGCHTIPGIPDARGLVGPPLDNIADRMIIAGVLANTPDNMTAWLMAPQSIVAGNAMPNMGLDRKDARDVAAYLYTLR
jgi:cytochrome c2